MPAAAFGSFVAAIPPPLSIGTVRLADGRGVKGFIVEPAAVNGARESRRSAAGARFVGAGKPGGGVSHRELEAGDPHNQISTVRFPAHLALAAGERFNSATQTAAAYTDTA